MTDDITNIEAARARLRALREQRIAERIEAGEIVSVPLCIVAGSETEARAQVEQAKAAKLAELHAGDDQREVVFTVELVVTGVLRPGETADPASVPSAPAFSSREDIRPPLPPPPSAEVIEEEAQPQPPLVETPICVQIRRCRGDDDPGEIAEGYFSVDGKVLTVTDVRGGHVGSRAITAGEDPKTVARRLLRDKQAPEEEFTRELRYPSAGLA